MHDDVRMVSGKARDSFILLQDRDERFRQRHLARSGSFEAFTVQPADGSVFILVKQATSWRQRQHHMIFMADYGSLATVRSAVVGFRLL